MLPKSTQSRWSINWLRPRLFGNKHAIRPAEISDGLCKVMTAHENTLEDANYHKVVPNHFVVEISPQNYTLHFEPLGADLVHQWRERLLEHLLTSNSRLGKKEYRLGGQLYIDIHPVPGMAENQARILCRVDTNLVPPEEKMSRQPGEKGQEVAFLDLVGGDRSWPLYLGNTTIGRDEACDIFLNSPVVQEKRLVSAQHATIRIQDGQFLLYDGDMAGKSSVNGTYVNAKRVEENGVNLQDGDTVVLAAVNPADPRPDTPGVAAFRFRKGSRNERQA